MKNKLIVIPLCKTFKYFFIFFVFFGSKAYADLHTYGQQLNFNNLQRAGLVKPSLQTISFHFPPNAKPWKLVDQSPTDTGYSFTYVPKNTSYRSANEIIDTFNIPYDRMPGITAKKLMQLEIADAKKHCRVQAKVISTAGNAIVYQTNITQCNNGSENQIRYSKAFNGKEEVYVTHYTVMTGKVSKDEFELVSNAIKTAKLIFYPS